MKFHALRYRRLQARGVFAGADDARARRGARHQQRNFALATLRHRHRSPCAEAVGVAGRDSIKDDGASLRIAIFNDRAMFMPWLPSSPEKYAGLSRHGRRCVRVRKDGGFVMRSHRHHPLHDYFTFAKFRYNIFGRSQGTSGPPAGDQSILSK